ncbi:hypothetical protein OD90_2556 [Dokdonia sp. Hel_I_53]|nr:hypothetical protein OD90_2556 [Dokdonia sp. Hel_I_53]
MVWLVAVIALVMWLLFVLKDARQVKGSKLLIRALLGFVAVASLALLYLEPQIPTARSKSLGIILTENYNKKQLDSLKNLHTSLIEIPYNEDGFRQEQLDSIDKFYILGNGIESYDFWQLHARNTSYLGGNEVRGIIRLNYNERFTLGDSLKILGAYRKPQGTQLILKDPAGTSVDSLQLTTSLEDQLISLGETPKATGMYIYTLVEKDSLGKVQRIDPLPIIVSKKEVLNILMLQTFPTFESKYLKNYLTADGHRILSRVALTKGKYKFESLNRAKGTIYGLTKSNLENFDLIIMDIASYRQLSRSSNGALVSSLQDGLGMFIYSDGNQINTLSSFGFKFKRASQQVLTLPQYPAVTIPSIPYKFIDTPMHEPILSTNSKNITAYSLQGNGKVGTSLLTDTYQLQLRGNAAVYNYIWATTLKALRKKSNVSTWWSAEDIMATADKPYKVNLRSNLKMPTALNNRGNHIGLKQDLTQKNKWSTTIYPKTIGWDSINIQQDPTATHYFYVSDSLAWEHKKAYTTTTKNKAQFNNSAKEKTSLAKITPLNPLWLCGAFLIAMGCLWLFPKWRG